MPGGHPDARSRARLPLDDASSLLNRTRVRPLACPAVMPRPGGSDADGVPDRLHLQEGGDPLGALGGAVIEPVDALTTAAWRPGHALHVLDGRLLDSRDHLRRHAPRI